jgi:hypothetical protein
MPQSLYDYSQRKGIRPISWEDFHGLCKALAAAASRFEPEIILPVGRGGYSPSTLISHMLQVGVHPVRLSRRINDVAIQLVKQKATGLGSSFVRNAVLYPHSWGISVPDCIGLITDEPILNSWDREIFRDSEFWLAKAIGQDVEEP